MANLEPVAAGFILVPTRERERQYLAWYVERGEVSLPLEEALFEIRSDAEGRDVVLVPFRSYDAAVRMRKLFERAAKEHHRAEKQRARFSSVT